eukprot:scaffold38931_cov66-Phaeocystis_antarctica.AAC.1
MQWTSTRPRRPRLVQRANTPQKARVPGGEATATHMVTAIVRAINRAWHGKAMRKSCAAKANSCEGSEKVPVTRCISVIAATASQSIACCSGSGSSSLRGVARARSGSARSRFTRGVP